jgi:hypothetical protein
MEINHEGIYFYWSGSVPSSSLRHCQTFAVFLLLSLLATTNFGPFNGNAFVSGNHNQIATPPIVPRVTSTKWDFQCARPAALRWCFVKDAGEEFALGKENCASVLYVEVSSLLLYGLNKRRWERGGPSTYLLPLQTDTAYYGGICNMKERGRHLLAIRS